MSNPSLAQSFENLFSLTGLIAFLAGMLAQYVYCWSKDRYRDRIDPTHSPHRTKFKSLLLLWVLVYVVVGFMAVKQQRMSEDSLRCNREFHQRETEIIDIQNDYMKANTVQLKEVSAWFHDALFPPPEIAQIRQTDPNWQVNPTYIKWALEMTSKHEIVIQLAQEQQAVADEARKQRPLPEPKCGVE